MQPIVVGPSITGMCMSSSTRSNSSCSSAARASCPFTASTMRMLKGRRKRGGDLAVDRVVVDQQDAQVRLLELLAEVARRRGAGMSACLGLAFGRMAAEGDGEGGAAAGFGCRRRRCRPSARQGGA